MLIAGIIGNAGYSQESSEKTDEHAGKTIHHTRNSLQAKG